MQVFKCLEKCGLGDICSLIRVAKHAIRCVEQRPLVTRDHGTQRLPVALLAFFQQLKILILTHTYPLSAEKVGAGLSRRQRFAAMQVKVHPPARSNREFRGLNFEQPVKPE